MKTLILTIALIAAVQTTTLAEMFGLGSTLMNLGKMNPVVNYDGSTSTAYTLDPTIFKFLANFATRTDFCNYKCPLFYHLPCFILFGCNIQLRNFILMILLPLILIILMALCCAKGIWTFGCWARYLAIFTGVSLLVWVVKKCVQGSKTKKTKKKEMELHATKQKEKQQETGDISMKEEIEPQAENTSEENEEEYE